VDSPDAATSLMDAGESAGVQMPFGCRMGICQSCVIGLVEGHVRDLRTGAEHNREPGANMHFRRFRRLRVGRLDFTRQ
jgi:ferredoxin